MLVKAKKTFENLKEIFQKGDILTLNIETYQEDTIICNALYGQIWNGQVVLLPSKKVIDHNKLPEGVWKFCDPVIAKKGSYKSSTITTADGRTYNTSIINHCIGYSHKLPDIFEKVS